MEFTKKIIPKSIPVVLTIGMLFSCTNDSKKVRDFLADKNLGIGAVLPLFRLVLTGQGMGPSMFEIASFLGRDECCDRITHGIEAVQVIKKEE